MTEAAKRTERRLLTSGTHHGALPEIGTWLWGMKEARRGLLSTLDRIERAGFGQEFLDWRGPNGQDNSVGALLYRRRGDGLALLRPAHDGLPRRRQGALPGR